MKRKAPEVVKKTRALVWSSGMVARKSMRIRLMTNELSPMPIMKQLVRCLEGPAAPYKAV